MPARVTTFRRPKISNDVLILILEKLSPVSLYRTCQAFERVFALVMDFQNLRYKFELAVVGMKDGPVSYAMRSPIMRLHLLLAYKKDWPRLKWIDEQKVRAPATAMKIEVSGSFLYYVSNQTLDLIELPSCRTEKPPSQTRHIRYNTNPDANCVVIDSSQMLIITGHIHGGPDGQIGLRLKIRNLWTFEKHPRGAAAYYNCTLPTTQPISDMSMSVCGTRLVYSLELVGGASKHLLMDWSTLQARWLDEEDVVLLNPCFLLGVRKSHGKVALLLYNIADLRNVAAEREYELPPIWNSAVMRFGRNAASNADGVAPTSLFYSDPLARVLLLSAKQPETGITHWMFVSESYFRPTTHADRRSVPWSYWTQFCLVKELQLDAISTSPQVVGSRVTYLEKNGTRSASGRECSRLKIIDFAPYADVPAPSPKAWSHFGKYSSLKPTEYQREFSSSTTNALAVEKIYATEDNIILLLERAGDINPVNILTFGPSGPLKTTR